jgi:hypothetical protein
MVMMPVVPPITSLFITTRRSILLVLTQPSTDLKPYNRLEITSTLVVTVKRLLDEHLMHTPQILLRLALRSNSVRLLAMDTRILGWNIQIK